MKTEFLKWGNSLALRVPKAFAQEMGVTEGKPADMTVEDGVLVVKVAKPVRQRQYSLKSLVDAITHENTHSGEIDWGPKRGNEVW